MYFLRICDRRARSTGLVAISAAPSVKPRSGSSTMVSMMTGMSRKSGSALSADEHAPAVHAGHHHVQGDGHRPQLARQAQPCLASGGGAHAKAFLAQKALNQVALHRIVVDHQHAAAVGAASVRRRPRRLRVVSDDVGTGGLIGTLRTSLR